jgi:hypothetical protein
MQDESRCGTVLVMPTQIDPDALAEAEAAVRHAQMVRNQHRRRTERGSPTREADIALALDRLKAAMRPLRSEIGRFKYGSAGDDSREAIRGASLAIQKERRKLWKMRSRSTAHA